MTMRARQKDRRQTNPALSTRRAETDVELRDGQSFAIAGLLRDNVRESVAKFPVLGDIPVLGALFRSSRYVKNQTELVIIVTPHFTFDGVTCDGQAQTFTITVNPTTTVNPSVVQTTARAAAGEGERQRHQTVRSMSVMRAR